MEYLITCISHDRHENLAKFFEKVGTNEVVFFVKDETDKKNYLENGAKEVVISGPLVRSRNASLQHCFRLNKICVQLSDDLEKIMINDFTGKRTHQYTTVKNVLEDLIPDFTQSSYYFAGFPPTNNPFFALNPKEINKFIVGDFMMVKPCHFLFDENLRLKEDYDLTLQFIKGMGGCLRYGKYLTSFKHYTNKGGVVGYRDTALEQKTIQYLIDKWGECIKLNSKRENEILLNKNSLEILTSQQTSLF